MISNILLLFVILVTIQGLTVTKHCVCSEIMTQTECVLNPICNWSTSCVNRVCKEFTTQTTCDSTNTCAWGTACADFTQCADYKVTISTDCLKKKKGACEASTSANADGTFSCKNIIPVTCSTFTNKPNCSGIQMDAKMCYWTTTCTAQPLTTCTGITDSLFCLSLGCKWTTTCSSPACADITDQTSCTFIRGDDMDSRQICAWVSNKCADAENTSTLTSSTCFAATAFSYKWNTSTSTCIVCTGSTSNYSGILFHIVLVIALLF